MSKVSGHACVQYQAPMPPQDGYDALEVNASLDYSLFSETMSEQSVVQLEDSEDDSDPSEPHPSVTGL